MRIAILYPRFAAFKDGIADHTDRLASALAQAGHVVIILADAQNRTGRCPTDARVRLEWLGGDNLHSYFDEATVALKREGICLAILQFEQFAYGRRGWAPSLPALASRVRDAITGPLAVVAHEDFVYPESVRTTVMFLYQRRQFVALLRRADLALMSTDGWAEKYARFVGAGRGTAVHLPVVSNLPSPTCSRSDAKRRLGIPADALTLGVFGGLEPHKNEAAIRGALHAVHDAFPDMRSVYVGGMEDSFLRLNPADWSFTHTARSASDEEASNYLAAIDIALCPFRDGASTRRSSLLAHLQHGSAVATWLKPKGEDTMSNAHQNGVFSATPIGSIDEYAEEVLRLASDPVALQRYGVRGMAYFDEHHTWAKIADSLMLAVESTGRRRP